MILPNCEDLFTIKKYWAIIKQKLLKNNENVEDIAAIYQK